MWLRKKRYFYVPQDSGFLGPIVVSSSSDRVTAMTLDSDYSLYTDGICVYTIEYVFENNKWSNNHLYCGNSIIIDPLEHEMLELTFHRHQVLNLPAGFTISRDEDCECCGVNHGE